MDRLSIQTNYEHKSLVNNPPFITNHPADEKLQLYRNEFRDNGVDLFKSEYSKDKKDNRFITVCVLGAFLAVIAAGVFLYRKLKYGIKKIR